jgi:hypothetical protein
MKIDDSLSPSIAALAMPKGSNFLTDIGDGISGYYKQKDEDRKNAILMKKADDEMLDRQTQADYLNSGKSYTDWIASGGTAFKTPEAIKDTTKFIQDNSIWDLRHTEAKNKIHDGTIAGMYFTPPNMAKDGNYFTTMDSVDKVKDWGIKDEKINIDKQKIIEDSTHNRNTEEIATVNSGIAATNAQTNIENAKTNRTNAVIKAAEVEDKIKNKDKPKELSPAQILSNKTAQEKLNEKFDEQTTKYYADQGVDFSKIPIEQQKYINDFYKRNSGYPAVKLTDGLFGTGIGEKYYVPEYTNAVKKQQLIEAIKQKKQKTANTKNDDWE